MKTAFARNLRIVWAITAKDIVEGFKNKNILGNVLSALFLIVFYKFLPVLTQANEPPYVCIYDAGESTLVAALEESSAMQLRVAATPEAMQERVAGGSTVELGLELPADFDRRLAAGEAVVLEGYTVYWAKEADVEEVVSLVEREIESATGGPVTIDVAGNVVYPSTGLNGQSFAFAVLTTVVITMMGVIPIPHLMLEEKKTKTLDALLISPASIGQVVLGKAFAGLFYTSMMVAVVLIFNASLILHWWLVILVALCGTLFAVALGLLFGVLFDVRQQLVLWGFVSMQVLLLPAFLSLMTGLVPDPIIAVIRWVPTSAMAYLFQVACTRPIALADFWAEMVVVMGGAVLALVAVVWAVRRTDQ